MESQDCPEPREMRVCLVSQEARETADSMDYPAAMAKTGFREPMEPKERPEYVLRKDAPIVRREREDLLEIQDPEDKMETSASTALREIPVRKGISIHM